MLFYIFIEDYPNPYKPQIDSEFAYLLRQGHDVRIFASGQFVSIIHPRVRTYRLDQRVRLFPTTLRTLPKHLHKIGWRLITAPKLSVRSISRVYSRTKGIKKNVMSMARALILPITPPDVCYIHNIATASSIDFLSALYPDTPVIMYFHGGEVGGVKKVARDQQLFAQMRLIFANTEFARRQALSRGSPPDRTVVLPVGFDLEDYEPNATRSYRPDGVLRLVSIGRLGEEKGLNYAIDALSILVSEGFTDLHYSIVGRGMEEVSLKEYVSRLGIDPYVEFLGEKDKREVVSILSRSDVLILPSIVTDTWAETQGAVIQEAMFMRALVIASKTGGIPESIAAEMKSFAVPPNDSQSIANSIRTIASLSDEDFRRIGAAGRAFAVERFDIESIGAEFLRWVALSR
jgi:colanic acid/amylovoran biosynthesis glycosyltransferase